MLQVYDHYITAADRAAMDFRPGSTVFEIDTGNGYIKSNTGWVATSTGGAVPVVVANSLISYHWTSADATDAPDATNLADYLVGAASDGATGGAVYHTIDGAWVATGATVANLYGG